MYKVCIETLKRRKGFDEIFERLPSLCEDDAFASSSYFLPHVLLYEHLFGHGLSKCNAKWRKVIENHNADLARLKNEIDWEMKTNSADKSENDTGSLDQVHKSHIQFYHHDFQFKKNL